MKKHVMVVFGTRPEAIKLCPLVLELRRHGADFKTTVCVTAQHRQMLDQVLDLFGVEPNHDLDIMRPNQSLEYITSNCLTKVGETITAERPDIVLVQGDTTTSFATGLAAFYHQVPVGHVEAGLRTYNKYSPYPEEINRRLTSAIADLHFAPTSVSRDNLLRDLSFWKMALALVMSFSSSRSIIQITDGLDVFVISGNSSLRLSSTERAVAP